MTGRQVIAGTRRATAIVATLGLLAVAALCAHLVATSDVFAETEFSGAAFRAATATRDGGAMRDQAHAAVDSHALIGLSPASLRRTLGPPSRIGQRKRHYVWDLGEVSGFVFGGSGIAQLYVDLDAGGSRAERSAVYEPTD
ncbi:hypothetical protein OM076_38090 [Solirubrobacter ginsenosidimutans]|uniref:Lipoprotein SmpA/OmlA domain-containing protein n=1 Tax=Solirubrobacter ginsenosidimutans TaxID=490573 RepID=A0A9X3SAK6_9ACTN|nr:hypothetical protein [Solirubrobacter ginsenosidimutans]MDA0166138.1 hypothetical protein [Solirubrobacter ginsenosidimutans]